MKLMVTSTIVCVIPLDLESLKQHNVPIFSLLVTHLVTILPVNSEQVYKIMHD